MTETFRILVAEDNLVNQEIMAEMLSLVDNVDVAIVENGQEAIDSLKSEHFDLILMDINMPVLTGDEATKQIRASEEGFKDIPIYVLTANALAGQKEEYLACGADSYLAKPVDIDQLLQKVEALIAKGPYKQTAVA